MIYRDAKGNRLFEEVEEKYRSCMSLIATNARAVFANEVKKSGSQFIYDIQKYMNRSMATALSSEIMYKYLSIISKKPDKDESAYIQLGMLYWVYMWCLDTQVCYIIDTDNITGALYTRNKKVLQEALGVRLEAKKIEEIDKKLYGTSTAKGFEENSVFAYRLDVDNAGKNYRFKPVAPRQRLKVSNIAVVPISAMYGVGDALNNLLSKNAAKYLKDTENGPVRHVITTSKDIIRANYKGVGDTSEIENKIAMLDEPGFDVLQCRYMGYDLEAPLSSNKMATFKFEKLDAFTQAKPSEVDKSLLGLDVDIVKKSYISTVKGLNSEKLKKVDFVDLSSFNTVKDAQAMLIEFGVKSYSEDLYRIMKSRPEIFGDADAKIKNMQKAKPKVLKGFKDITEEIKKLSSIEDKQRMLYKCGKTGVLKVIARAKKGYTYEINGTLNTEVLDRCWGGRDRWMACEAPRTRLKYAMELVEQGVNPDEVISKLDIASYVDLSEDCKDDIGAVSSAINRGIESLNEIKKSDNNSNITLRSVDNTDTSKFIRSVGINSIEKVFFSIYKEK